MSWQAGGVNQRPSSRPRAAEDEDVVGQTIDSEPTVDDPVSLKKHDSVPWYKRPSPWWILVTMPLSAMALSGSGPSLLQIYIGIVCKSQHPDSVGAGNFTMLHTLSGLDGRQHHGYLAAFDSVDCAKDPKVQQTVSLLTGVLLTTQGVLSILTAASWASLSDRVGRRTVLAISTTAMLFCYGYYLFIFLVAKNASNAFWSLILGPFVAGILGGTAVGQAASNAYIADSTASMSRARVFSLALGARFIGMAIGPTLCSILVKASGTPVAAIVLVIAVHVFNLAFILFVMPESLSEARRADNKRLRSESPQSSHQLSAESELTIHSRLKVLKKAFSFLKPLTIIGPIPATTASGRAHKDYSMSFIAFSTCIASIILASNQTLFLFAFHTYSWTAVRIGYWNSGMVAARAATLLVFLPAIIKAYHYYAASRKENLQASSTAEEVTPLLDTGSQEGPPATSTSAASVAIPPHSPVLDLAIGQGSLILECICYLVLPLVVSPRQPGVFVALTILASCGSGFGPAIQALSVELFTRRGGTETGRLFGVLSVLQVTSSQIVGPMLYSLAYTKFVATYPQGVFFVSFAASVLSTTALFFVELPHGIEPSRLESDRSA